MSHMNPDGEPMSETTTVEHRGAEWYAMLAKRATEHALDQMGANEDAGAALSLATTAWDVVMGSATDDQRADMNEYVMPDDGGYELVDRRECICPPELLARGGFRGGCPVHA